MNISKTYIVTPADWKGLYSIAKKFGLSNKEIRNRNPHLRRNGKWNIIRTGDVVHLTGPSAFAQTEKFKPALPPATQSIVARKPLSEPSLLENIHPVSFENRGSYPETEGYLPGCFYGSYPDGKKPKMTFARFFGLPESDDRYDAILDENAHPAPDSVAVKETPKNPKNTDVVFRRIKLSETEPDYLKANTVSGEPASDIDWDTVVENRIRPIIQQAIADGNTVRKTSKTIADNLLREAELQAAAYIEAAEREAAVRIEEATAKEPFRQASSAEKELKTEPTAKVKPTLEVKPIVLPPVPPPVSPVVAGAEEASPKEDLAEVIDAIVNNILPPSLKIEITTTPDLNSVEQTLITGGVGVLDNSALNLPRGDYYAFLRIVSDYRISPEEGERLKTEYGWNEAAVKLFSKKLGQRGKGAVDFLVRGMENNNYSIYGKAQADRVGSAVVTAVQKIYLRELAKLGYVAEKAVPFLARVAFSRLDEAVWNRLYILASLTGNQQAALREKAQYDFNPAVKEMAKATLLKIEASRNEQGDLLKISRAENDSPRSNG